MDGKASALFCKQITINLNEYTVLRHRARTRIYEIEYLEPAGPDSVSCLFGWEESCEEVSLDTVADALPGILNREPRELRLGSPLTLNG